MMGYGFHKIYLVSGWQGVFGVLFLAFFILAIQDK
jgi:hypothetical protein